jgi:hypothetical protein
MTPAINLFRELTFFIDAGAIERADDGLVAYLEMRSPFRSVNDLNERLGLRKLELLSTAHVLSTEYASPTVFSQEKLVTLPAGTDVPKIVEEGTLILNVPITCQSTTRAIGILRGHRFTGEFLQRCVYAGLPNLVDNFVIDGSGRFEAELG